MISKKAQIGKNVIIGESVTIEDDVIIGDNVTVGSCAFIGNGARISEGVKIFHGAIVSAAPQDLKYKNEPTICEIGENTIIRECASVHRGTTNRKKTVVGGNCLIMSYAHIAHDCLIGNNVIMANCASLAGHVSISDWVIIGGLAGIVQFLRAGKHSFVTAGTLVTKEIPPFIIAHGTQDVRFMGLNVVGLKRRGFENDRIRKIKDVYELIFNSQYNVSDAIKKIKNEIESDDDVTEIINFIETSKNGIIKGL
jgi:UDP-N-acetylglucosamine acyltransferase